MPKQKRTRVIFFGDSITVMGRAAEGYISLSEKLLAETGKVPQLELIAAGVAGNKVYDLYLRLEEDVLSKEPGVVVIWIGVNDVWHKTSGVGTDLDKFEKFYTAIIRKLQAQKIKLILCTPAVIGEKRDAENKQDADVNLYCETIRRLATTFYCRLVDIRKVFVDYIRANNLQNREAGVLTTDGVHLNAKGNLLVAQELFKELMTGLL